MKTIIVLGNASVLTLGGGGPDIEPWRPTYDI
jgi:hypothetical protein